MGWNIVPNLLDAFAFGPLSPSIARLRPNLQVFVQHWPEICQARHTSVPDSTEFSPIQTSLARIRPNLACIRTKLARFRQCLTRIRPVSANFDGIWPELDQTLSVVDQSLVVAAFDQTWAASTEFGPVSAQFGPGSAIFGRCRPKSAKLGPDFDAQNRQSCTVFSGPRYQRSEVRRVHVGQRARKSEVFEVHKPQERGCDTQCVGETECVASVRV